MVGLMATSSKRTYAIPTSRAPVPVADHCRPIPDGETVETVADFIFFLAPKSLQMVTSAMKLKNAYCLEENL